MLAGLFFLGGGGAVMPLGFFVACGLSIIPFALLFAAIVDGNAGIKGGLLGPRRREMLRQLLH